MIRAKSRSCAATWRLTRWSRYRGLCSGPDEDRPQRPEDEERSERDVRPPTDPFRREQDDDDDPAEDEREDDAPERPAAPRQQADADQQLDVAQPERAGTE